MTTRPENAPGLEARRARALQLVRAGRSSEAIPHLRSELEGSDSGVEWLISETTTAMEAGDLGLAGRLAKLLSVLRYGPNEGRASKTPVPGPMLSVGKLRHDAEQIRHLRKIGVLGAPFDDVAAAYDRTAERLDENGKETRLALSELDDDLVTNTYGRIAHVREAPRLEHAISDRWDPEAAQEAYLTGKPGVVVIDDFLVPEALESLRRFCLESTVWLANRYPNGRLGSFFVDGFNAPLLLQIAEELRERLGRIIGDRHPLRQLWGFKYPPRLPGDSTIHADFAAVNVNFWIMPEEANLDPNSGGLLVYDLAAPRAWDFATYNQRLDLIKDYVRRSQPRVINVPYRANRAIIFDSDLFHATAEINFRPEYEHRRVNITMLYGVREQDEHHGQVSMDGGQGQSSQAWRSPALTRTRRR